MVDKTDTALERKEEKNTKKRWRKKKYIEHVNPMTTLVLIR